MRLSNYANDPRKALFASVCEHRACMTSRRRPMASLSIRKLDDETYGRLRDRATRKGVSMEEEVRARS